jgi:hypothetical protein
MVFLFVIDNITVQPIDEPNVNNDSPRLDKTGKAARHARKCQFTS